MANPGIPDPTPGDLPPPPPVPDDEPDIGPTGPRGPNGARINWQANTTSVGPSVQLDGYTYSTSCTVTPNSGTFLVTTTFAIAIPNGVTANVYGFSQIQTNDTGAMTATSFNLYSLTVSHSFPTPANNQLLRQYTFVTVADSTGNIQQINFRISANGLASPAAGESRCMIEGDLLPTSG